MGFLQLHGRTASNHFLFNITGTFHNPGPFAGFVVSALPLALGVMLSLTRFGYSGKKTEA
jgi:O-antigen polymerase